MKNIFLNKLIIISSVGLAMLNNVYAKDPIQQDNKIMLNYSDNYNGRFKITNFDVIKYSVTDGQPWGGVSVSSSNELNVMAGRKGSNTNNDIFEGLSGYNVPKSLTYNNVNFSIIGNLSFTLSYDWLKPNTSTFSCHSIALQQAHVEAEWVFTYGNVWYFYSNSIGEGELPISVNNPKTAEILCMNNQTHDYETFILFAENHNKFHICKANMLCP